MSTTSIRATQFTTSTNLTCMRPSSSARNVASPTISTTAAGCGPWHWKVGGGMTIVASAAGNIRRRPACIGTPNTSRGP